MTLNEVGARALEVEERSDETPRARASGARPAPDPEVVAKPKRRPFTAEYRLRILEEADRCMQPGEVGRLLRREGLYTSHLAAWRKARRQGSLRGLTPSKRGARPAERNPLSAKVRELEATRLDRRLPDRDLGWLDEGTGLFDRYWEAVTVAQDYAQENRRAMTEACLEALVETLPPFDVTNEAIECHHNYASRERHAGADVFVTRKGAISARAGELGIVPGSMGAHSYIVRGRGNTESFHSCAHGAGRLMSRGAAKRQFTTADLEEQTAGIECRKDTGVIDEIPSAYKPIDDVMDRQNDLAEPVHKLRQVLNIKG